MSKKKFNVADIECGSDTLFLISGPCVIESLDIMRRTAEKLKIVSDRLRIPLIYKSSFQKDNRSSVDYYQGPGLGERLGNLGKNQSRIWFPSYF